MEANKNIQEVLDSLKGLQVWWQRDRESWNDVFCNENTGFNWDNIDEWELNFIDHEPADFFPLQIWQCLLSGKRKAQITRRIISIRNDDMRSFIPVIQWSIALTDNTRLQKFYPPKVIETLLNEKKLKIQNDFMFKYKKFEHFQLRFLIEKMDNQSNWDQQNREKLASLLSCWADKGEFRGSLANLQDYFVAVETVKSIKGYEYE